jgi:DNA-binding protein H-NS
MNLNNMSLDELKRLNKAVTSEITNFPDKAKTAARIELETKAKELGYSLTDLLGVGVKTRKKRLVIVRYRNPNNPAITWTGAGRRPNWFLEALASGKSRSDLAI